MALANPRDISNREGFSLVELVVSTAVFGMLLLILFGITGEVGKMWRETTGSIGEWQSARAGFEMMTRRISQATLNTTWAYFDGLNGTGNLTTTDPKSYGRYSELQFVTGPSAAVIGQTGLYSHSVFFQAPLGRTTDANLEGLPHLLNACGFFIVCNDDAAFVPDLKIFTEAQHRRRFRLMELVVPSERLAVYHYPGSKDFEWFRLPIEQKAARPLAENIVALFVLPKLSQIDNAADALLAPDYEYNSRIGYSFDGGGSLKGNTLHQLPPLIQVTMVALDETSAQRMEARYDADTFASKVFDNAPFSRAALFDDDMVQLEKNLTGLGVRYKIFSSTIAIRGAKWSDDKL